MDLINGRPAMSPFIQKIVKVANIFRYQVGWFCISKQPFAFSVKDMTA
jgi:hypothetical protein